VTQKNNEIVKTVFKYTRINIYLHHTSAVWHKENNLYVTYLY